MTSLPRLFLTVAFGAFLLSPVLAKDATSARWEPDIAAFEKRDAETPPPKGGILFIGSSSIRKWTTLTQDFPDLPVINRGFGGSILPDSTAFADRIVFPYQPKLIVMYAGSNDIHAKRSAEQVAADFRGFVEKVRSKMPNEPIDYISISPNPARWAEIDEIRKANAMIEKYCHETEGLTFINTHPTMLGEDGKPLPDIFVEDRLHMNAKGYAIWTKFIRPYLDKGYSK